MTTIAVIDVEATCWATREEQGDKPNEIIEIGFALLDYPNEILANDGILVRPRSTKISEFCESLTTISQGMVDTWGIELDLALEKMYDLFTEHKVTAWCSCGKYDYNMLVNRLPHNVFGDVPWFNIKDEFTNITKRKASGMNGMLKYFNIKASGTHHRGKDDALNLARIMGRLYSVH